MSTYIDADYIKRYPIRIDHYDEIHGNRHFVLGIESVMDYIEEAPSIDIVFCEECRDYVEKGTGADCPSGYGYLYCRRKKSVVDEDDYCSWGERR